MCDECEYSSPIPLSMFLTLKPGAMLPLSAMWQPNDEPRHWSSFVIIFAQQTWPSPHNTTIQWTQHDNHQTTPKHHNCHTTTPHHNYNTTWQLQHNTTTRTQPHDIHDHNMAPQHKTSTIDNIHGNRTVNGDKCHCSLCLFIRWDQDPSPPYPFHVTDSRFHVVNSDVATKCCHSFIIIYLYV